MRHYNLASYFAEGAKAHAARPALRYPDRSHSYAELMDWAQRLANLLLQKGCKRGDVIAIGHNKRPLSYALMLAALRLGVAYVNIDVASPAARNARILTISGAKLLFFDDPAFEQSLQGLPQLYLCELIFLTEDDLAAIAPSDLQTQQRLMRDVDGSCIAYLMFTSGSTGAPKGVAVTHQNVLHFICWGQTYFNVAPQDNFANLSPMYFDNSVFDFYVGLFSGASLTPVYRELMTAPYQLIPYVGKMQCTIWFSVPSLLIYVMAMKAMTANALPTLRHIVFGGEGYPKTELKKLYDLFSHQASLVNVYGPTECTCICSAHRLEDRDFDDMQGLPTLGHLNQNFDYRIVDEQDHDMDTGELCLIGPNVAAGYFNDPDRTALSFSTLLDPARFMKRMYRTGDIVRESEGRLYFVGRKDNQIKHMGYRIELEEIEHALVTLPQVDQAAVIYERTNVAYGKLIGFVAASTEIEEKALLGELARLLPEYMLPNKLVVLAELPKSPNGKVDRQHLRKFLNK